MSLVDHSDAIPKSCGQQNVVAPLVSRQEEI